MAAHPVKSSTGLPNGRSRGYELYGADGEFVLALKLPGFDPERIDVA